MGMAVVLLITKLYTPFGMLTTTARGFSFVVVYIGYGYMAMVITVIKRLI